MNILDNFSTEELKNLDNKGGTKSTTKSVKKRGGPKRNFLPFEEARAFVHKLGLKNHKEWKEYAKTDRPLFIPSDPQASYKGKGWTNYGDWLGNSNYRRRSRSELILSFEEARKFARSLKLIDSTEWLNWTKSGNRPLNIPSEPRIAYKNEWQGWADWLGPSYKDSRKCNQRPFKEAREFARSLGLKSLREWNKYCKSGNKPNDIPHDCRIVYEKTGEWTNWGDFLGTNNVSNPKIGLDNVEAILPVLYSLRANFDKMSEATKINIIKQAGNQSLLTSLKASRPNLAKITDLKLGTDDKALNAAIKILENSQARLKSHLKIKSSDLEESSLVKAKQANLVRVKQAMTARSWGELIEIYGCRETLATPVLPKKKDINNVLKVDLKTLLGADYSIDSEIVQAIVLGAVYKLLDLVLANESVLDDIPQFVEDNEFSHQVVSGFWSIYNEAINLEIPNHNWKHSFNLMQRVIGVRLLKEKRLANFSGTGSGKTASALLSSLLIAEELEENITTVIVTENNTLEGWRQTINEIVPNAKVIVNSYNICIHSQHMTYLLYNYEKFQNGDAESYIQEILRLEPQFMIVDEIHKMKGGNKEESKRRRAINRILHSSIFQDNDRYVLGMTATPLKNRISEFKSVIESITGKRHKELDLENTIENACLAHSKIPLYAVRCKGKLAVPFTTHTIKINGKRIATQLSELPTNHPYNFSEALLPLKLRGLRKILRPGTVIYTHFVDNIVDKLIKEVEKAGLTVGVYTGQVEEDIRLSDLEQFKAGKIDVLIGSSAIGTGVDGLQKVADNLIFITPPYTHAEYEQVRGRVVRQGSNASHVDIYHLQVEIEDREEDFYWSWDSSMYDLIKYKRDLSDAVLDGVVSLKDDATAEQLTKQSKKSLEQWIERIQSKSLSA